jgi:SOS-response transcriptional repressor LexA
MKTTNVHVNAKKVHDVHEVHAMTKALKKRDRKDDTLTVRVSARVKTAFEELSEREERTVSHMAGKVLGDWLDRYHPELLARADEVDAAVAGRLFDETWGACQVPLYDVRAAAGEGNFISEENLERYLELTRRFVADLGTVPENLVGLRVMGDSMEPELVDGDVVLVNTHLDAGVPPTEDIYVFRLGGELYVKRLRPDGAGGATAISTNPAYPPFEIPAHLPEGDFRIFGRLAVRWREPD